MQYFILIKEQLDPSWQEWFEPLTLSSEIVGRTVLRGSLPDQAALYRVLLKIQSLGLVLLSLETDGNSTPFSVLGERTGQRFFSDSCNHNTEMHTTQRKETVMNKQTTSSINGVNLSASNLAQSDLAGVTAQHGNFKGSALRGTDFTGADLAGSSLRGSDVREANFAGANLTDCDLSSLDLTHAIFSEAILVRTNFSKSGLSGARFIDIKLADVNFKSTDLRQTTFQNCTFRNVDFSSADLSGQSFDGQTFLDVTFDLPALKGVSFQGATLKNVSFRQTGIWSLKSAIQSINFDGALMDKLTYVSLKGLEANVSKVTVLP
jgi:uncharacterized protein YjbI with pentapeptide repeats